MLSFKNNVFVVCLLILLNACSGAKEGPTPDHVRTWTRTYTVENTKDDYARKYTEHLTIREDNTATLLTDCWRLIYPPVFIGTTRTEYGYTLLKEWTAYGQGVTVVEVKSQKIHRFNFIVKQNKLYLTPPSGKKDQIIYTPE